MDDHNELCEQLADDVAGLNMLCIEAASDDHFDDLTGPEKLDRALMATSFPKRSSDGCKTDGLKVNQHYGYNHALWVRTGSTLLL